MSLVKYLYLLFLLTLPLGQFARLPLNLGFSGGVYLYDLILPLTLALWLAWKLGVEKSLKLPPLSGRIALFIGLAFLSLLSGLKYLEGIWELVVSALYLWRWLMYAGLYFVGWDLVKQGSSVKGQMLKILVVGVFLFAAAGLIQFILFPDFSQYVQHGWDPHYYRVLSTLFDPNFAGLYLTLGFVLILIRNVLDTKSKNISSIAALTTIPLAIVLTFSRSTYLAFVSAVGFLGLLKSRKLLLVMVLAGVLAFAAIPRVRTRVIGAVNLDETVQLRLENYTRTWQVIKDQPLLGVGFNTFRYVQEDYGYFRDERGVSQPGGHAGAGADNSFLFLWATTGILGLLAYLSLLWGQFRLGLEKNLALAVSVVAMVVHAQFVNSLFYPWIMAWMWVLTALSADDR